MGSELAAQARELEPGLPILFLSGYAERTVLSQGGVKSGSSFLEKPFSVDALTAKVREILDSSRLEAN